MCRSLLVATLILTNLAACGDQRSFGTASSGTDFGDYGYSDIYRYYGGPSVASQEVDAQRQADRHVTERR